MHITTKAINALAKWCELTNDEIEVFFKLFFVVRATSSAFTPAKIQDNY